MSFHHEYSMQELMNLLARVALLLVCIVWMACGGTDLNEDNGTTDAGSSGSEAGENNANENNDSNENNDVPVFQNNPSDALSDLNGMWFACDLGSEEYGLLFYADTVLASDYATGEETMGTYTATSNNLSISLPDWDFAEAATDDWVEMDVLVRFWTPNLDCYAVALDHTQPAEETVVQCPSVKYIEGVSWEDNHFHFGPGGDVKRRRWTELVGTDTLYAERFGVYLQIGDWLGMVFAGAEEGEQIFTGVVNEAGGIYIDQLEPEKGPCE
jgi:hypothetical protein